MAPESSPFTPGKPAPIELFAGREAEIERMRRGLQKVVGGSQEYFFLMGERGIGKTSLAHFARQLATNEFRCLGVHVYLGGVYSLEELTRRIVERLAEQVKAIEGLWEKAKSIFGGRIREMDLLGLTLRFDADKEELRSLTDNFPRVINSVQSQIADKRAGLTIILDDVNGLASMNAFANFVKSFVDEAATADFKLPVLVILVGLNEVRDQLLEKQPSLGRVFQVVEIGPLEEKVVEGFFQKTFSSVNITIEDEALKVLARYSGGLPALMHEVGDAVFWTNEDDEISMDDAFRGIVDAADNVGKKYLVRQVYQAIRSGRYRSTLRRLVLEFDIGMSFVKADVEEKLPPDERKVFHNFLRKMKDLNVLLPGTQRGEYHFANELFYLYMRFEAFRAQKESS